jgi:hypothetical protein
MTMDSIKVINSNPINITLGEAFTVIMDVFPEIEENFEVFFEIGNAALVLQSEDGRHSSSKLSKQFDYTPNQVYQSLLVINSDSFDSFPITTHLKVYTLKSEKKRYKLNISKSFV